MINEPNMQFVWKAGHGCVTLYVLPQVLELGAIEEDNGRLTVFGFSRNYWEDCIDDGHFKEFEIENDSKFSCIGGLTDLMLYLQTRAEWLYTIKLLCEEASVCVVR